MSPPTTATDGPAANPLRQALPRSLAIDPCAIVLFGVTGDLAHRKLLPALYELSRRGDLPNEYAIVGFGRRDWSDDQFRDEVHTTLADEAGDGFEEGWPEFAKHLAFVGGQLDEAPSFDRLKQRLDEVERALGTAGNRLFYLAVAPEFFATIVDRLGAAKLVYPRSGASPWSRVVVEKPFGSDLESARRLSADLARVLDERQIYRIDHYLGKETVQNILALRFGNSIFEPIWNRRHVRAVQITVAEEVGMAGGRGAFYDSAGALRDMVQNHMMQLLCLVAMEPPVDLAADSVRTEKVKVLQSLPRWGPAEVAEHAIRAQYVGGARRGEPVAGFLDEKGVAPGSTTPTYVAMRLTLDTWRWAGVPFFLRTGKRLPKRATEIAIVFNNPPTALFQLDVEGSEAVNQLVLRIQPNEGASFAIQAKIPGSRRRLQQVRMDFRYGTAFAIPSPEAYQRLLLDVMLGDPTLFTRTDEVESAWRFITPILDAWALPDAHPPLAYEAGTWGPSEADRLMDGTGLGWRRL